MLCCHDGTGLGHLRRISRIAAALQQYHSCLVVTGVREALWLVPRECELLKLPSWEGIDQLHATRHGRKPAIDMSRQEAMAFRRGLLQAAAKSFGPDAILVDYLPFGRDGELRDLLEGASAKKYLVHRGITDKSDETILRGDATEQIANSYDRIMVMADVRASDLAAADRYSPSAAAKIKYCGYIVPEVFQGEQQPKFDVVCSGGGGKGSEAVLAACVRAAQHNPDASFCIVFGPRSRLSSERMKDVPVNAKLVDWTDRMPELLASASVVVSTGGYNSVLEAVSGGARIMVYPSQRGSDDEQQTFATRLADFYPIRLVRDLDTMPELIREELAAFRRSGKAPFPLSASGIDRLVSIVAADLENGAASGNSDSLPVMPR